MSGVRELTSSDIPQVADLHREAMETGPAMTPALLDRYRHWLTSVFLESPMRSDGLGSLVFEDGGEILGFLGVVARRFRIGGTVFRGSAGSNFCVRQTRRGRVGMQMARAYLARSSDLAFIDQLTDRTRRIWDHLGMLAMPQSVRWTLPLRPAAHVLSLVGHRVPGPARYVTRSGAAVLDRLASRVPRSPFRYGPVALVAEDLTGGRLAEVLTEFGTDDYLRPVADDGSVRWLLERARALSQHGDLHAVGLRAPDGAVVGWYVYYAKSGMPSEVLQLVSTGAAAGPVLEHLALHAHDRGVVSLTGTLDQSFLTPLSEHWAMISPAPMATRWTMVHSTRREVLEAFWRGRLLLSRLDGEWFQQLARLSPGLEGRAPEGSTT